MMARICFWVSLICMVGSCTELEETQLNINNPRIRKSLEDRIKDYETEYLINCRRDMVEKAGVYVDSLIAEEINYQLSDSIVFPPKPDRPAWPGVIVLSDNEKAKPIFMEKIILTRDTVGRMK